MFNGFKQIEKGNLHHFEGHGMIYDKHIEKEINYIATIANIQIRKRCRKKNNHSRPGSFNSSFYNVKYCKP